MTTHERSGATVTDSAARPGPLGWLHATVADRESLRSWTQVANDGVIATAGILEIMSRAETVRAGIGSAIAYLLGAAIPLIITVVVPVAAESSLILALSSSLLSQPRVSGRVPVT